MATFDKTEKDFPPVEGSASWITKMRTFFRKLDCRGQLEVTIEDLLEVTANAINNIPNVSVYRADELVEAVVKLWFGHFTLHLPEAQRTSVHLNESHFIENLQKEINGVLRAQFMTLFVEPFFKAADTDEDGLITLNEFKALMRSFGVSDRDSDLNFKLLDTKRASKVSLETFRAGMADYFFSEEKNVKLKLFGPLVSYKRPEDYGHLDCGPYWEGKMRTMFRRLDIVNCGKLKCNDFILIARGIMKRGHLDKKKSDAVMKSMLNIWVKFVALDRDGRHFAEINEKEFVHNIRSLVNGEFRHAIDQFGWTFFKAVETANQGYLNMQEFRCLHEAWRVTREEADAMFTVIDQDKDGRISHDEYLHAWIDYFLGEDPASPFKTFFGPVISKYEAMPQAS